MATYNSAAAADSAVVSTSPARVLKVNAINISGSARYLMVFNATSLPSNGATPVWRAAVSAGQQVSVDFGTDTENNDEGLVLDTGCVLALSSSPATLTVTVANEGIFDAQYRN